MPAACTAALPAGVAGSVRGGRGWRDCASSRGRTASSGHEPCSLSLKGVCLLEAGGRSVSSSPVRSHSLKDTDTNRPPGGSQALAKRTSPDVRAHVPPALRPALRGPLLCLRFSSSAEEQPPPAPPGRSRRKSPPARRSGLVTSLAQAAREEAVHSGHGGPSRPPAHTWSPDAGQVPPAEPLPRQHQRGRRARETGASKLPAAAAPLDCSSAWRHVGPRGRSHAAVFLN